MRVHGSARLGKYVDGVEDDDVAAGQDLQNVEGVDEQQRLEHGRATHRRPKFEVLLSSSLLLLSS